MTFCVTQPINRQRTSSAPVESSTFQTLSGQNGESCLSLFDNLSDSGIFSVA